MWNDLSNNKDMPNRLNESIASSADLKESQSLINMNLNPFKIKVTSRPATGNKNNTNNNNKEYNVNNKENQNDIMNVSNESF